MRQAALAALRSRIAAIEAGTRTPGAVLGLGLAPVDDCFPQGGLPLGAWHEIQGLGMEAEICAAPAAFAARIACVLASQGEVVWIARVDDLYPPGLASLGFPAERLICVKVRSEAQGLAVLEEALAARGVAAAFAETESPSLVAGRRLQLACETSGAAGFVLNRRPYGGRGDDGAGSAAASRWRISPAPSDPAPGEPGLGPPRWRVELLRCRGGRAGKWTFEINETAHAPHPFHLVPRLADHGLAAANGRLSA